MRIHSLSVSSARRAAARHFFASRGLTRMLMLTECEEATEIISSVLIDGCQYTCTRATDDES